VAKKVPQKHGGEINQFQPGESGNPAGRPRKYVSQLKTEGYKLDEIHTTMKNIACMTENELKELDSNKDATILERTVARAILNYFKKGSLYALETLLTRTFGYPKETVDQTIKSLNITVSHGKRQED